MYTFLILHDSCFQLSAISSVAILNDTQQAALQYVITRSAQDSKSVSSKLLARVQGLGYSENDLKKYVFESGDVYTYTLHTRIMVFVFYHPKITRYTFFHLSSQDFTVGSQCVAYHYPHQSR